MSLKKTAYPAGIQIENAQTLDFLEAAANGTEKISIKAAASLASSLTLTLPTTDGSAGEALLTNGSGALSFGVVAGVPTATVVPFAGSSEPSGWLLCDGRSLDRTTFAPLFGALGTTYGADDADHFNIPDLRGRAPVGKDDMGGSPASRITSAGSGIDGAVLGDAGGSETHELTTAEMPSHTHIQDSHQHGLGSHTHGSAGGTTYTGGGAILNTVNAGIAQATSPNRATMPATGNTNNATATNQNTGSDAPHQNTQPSIILNYIIKV